MKEAGLKTLEAEQMKAATTEGGAGAGGATKPAGADKVNARVFYFDDIET